MATLPTSIAARLCCRYCGSTEAIKLPLSSHYASTRKTSQSMERMSVKNELIHRELAQHLKITCQKHHFRVYAMSRVSIEEVDRTYAHNPEGDKQEKGLDYRFRTETGGQVKVSVKKMNEKYAVNVEALSLQQSSSNDTLFLSWGVYRSDSTCCQTLDFKNTAPDANSITFESLFTQTSEDGYALELEFESEKVPFFLSFLLNSVSYANSESSEIRSHRHTKFCVPVGLGPGKPSPLGLSFLTDGSINFAIFSRDVEGVVLCLYDKLEADAPALELDLDPYVNRSGDIWHVSLQNTRNFAGYGYRIKSRDSMSKRLILDPYAKVVSTSKLLDSASNYLGLLSKVPTFDWDGDIHLNLPVEKLIVYRLNVQRFTEHKSSELPVDIAGTFSGLVEKLNHFITLGVNAVILEPIFPCDAKKGPYYPLHFFSPQNLNGSSKAPFSTINSMKEAVKRLHCSGIEVFLEVVFTHTADSGSLQGINDAFYYFANGVTESRGDLNCNFPVVQELVIDSLRHWVTEFHIDGFCFINASALLRGFHGETLSRPPLVEAITFDPILSRTKIIADCWDPTDQSQKETQFPHWKKWAEMNTKFCSDIRNFLRGEALLSDLATRLCGSGDMFLDGRGPAFSFNFIARNSGLSLVDLVSFSKDDLSSSELSWNCGEEGPTDKITVLEKRLKQTRNFLFILYLSLGVPVLNMGDECGESTGGSTAYLARKPFIWKTLLSRFGIQTTEFISFLSSFRARRGDLLQKRSFLEEENIDWYGSDQSLPDWDDPSSKFLAMTLKSAKADSKGSENDLFIAFNAAEESERVVLPSPPEGMMWSRLVDTALAYPGFFSADGERVSGQFDGLVQYEMKSHSCALFEAKAPTAGELIPEVVQGL